MVTGLFIPASSVGMHHLSKVTIGDHPYIKENALSVDGKDLKEDWIKLENKLPSVKSRIKDQSLKNITPGSNRLRKWCSKAYESSYESLYFWKNTDLLSDTSIACVLTIEDKLGSENAFKPDQDNERKLTQILKNISQDENPIEDINEEDGEEKWKRLEQWCLNSYKKGYTGPQSNLWKLVDKFCRNE